MSDNGKPRRYYVDIEGETTPVQSAAALVATRRCRTCIEADDGDLTGDPAEAIAQITDQCSTTPDYLLPDTPLREAAFRVVLAGGNEPKSAEEISDTLTMLWSSSPSRDISPRVVGRLLDHGRAYSIAAVEEPEEEAEEE
jgi:hypothetical protein